MLTPQAMLDQWREGRANALAQLEELEDPRGRLKLTREYRDALRIIVSFYDKLIGALERIEA
jgi:hypothetical protein